MTEFNSYKLKPVDYKFQVGDILIKIHNDKNIGQLALVESLDPISINNPKKEDYYIIKNYWRAIETLPGSQAKAGDTVYCISDTGGSCDQHNLLKVKSVTTDAIYPEPGQRLLRAKTTTTEDGWNWSKEHFVVLVKAEQPKYELDMPKQCIGYGWYVSVKGRFYYLRQDLTVQEGAGARTSNSGYWPTEAEALAARAKYLGESVQPEIKVGSHWERGDKQYSKSTPVGEIIKVISFDNKSQWVRWSNYRNGSYSTTEQIFRECFKPRTDLDNQASDQPENNTNQQMEKQMPNFNLTLLIQFLAAQAEEKVDATNAKHIGILAESNGTYVGYVYANTIKELQDIVRKPENEGRKLHIFDYNQTIAQKARPVTQVSRV